MSLPTAITSKANMAADLLKFIKNKLSSVCENKENYVGEKISA